MAKTPLLSTRPWPATKACPGSVAVSASAQVIFRPLTPPAALIASKAACADGPKTLSIAAVAPVSAYVRPTFTDVGVIPGCDEQELLLADAAALVALLLPTDEGEPLPPVVVGLLLLEELPQAERAPARRATTAIICGIWLTAIRPLTFPPPHSQRIVWYSSLFYPLGLMGTHVIRQLCPAAFRTSLLGGQCGGETLGGLVWGTF